MDFPVFRTIVFLLAGICFVPLYAQGAGGIADSLIQFEDRFLPENNVEKKIMAPEKPLTSPESEPVKQARQQQKEAKTEASEESVFSEIFGSDQTVVNLIILAGLGLLFILFRIKNRTSRRSYM